MAETTSEGIEDLAKTKALNTVKMSRYRNDHHLPFRSFNVDAPDKNLIASEAPEIEDARHEIIEATLKLHNSVFGPQEFLQSFQVTHI